MSTTQQPSTAAFQTLDWGRTQYSSAFERQLLLVRKRIANKVPDTLILNEHEPVYTIGARQGAEKHLVWKTAHLEQQGIEVCKTNRGGDITYHGPGQIVGYPILDLRQTRDLHAYLRDLEQVLIDTVAELGITADRRAGKTGIWVGTRKLAAIGVAVKQWVTYHGFALNVCPNLEHFSGIIPCGITDGTVSSLQTEMGEAIEMGKVREAIERHFWLQFAK